MKKVLRPYQEKAVQTIISGFQKSNKQLCVLPTGSGKTLIFCNIINALNRKTLVIAHTRELLHQILRNLRENFPSITCEIYRKNSKFNSQVVICSLQSAVQNSTLNKFKINGFDFLIVDECHRAAANGYKKIINELGFDKKKILGATATPYRTDRKSITELFGITSFNVSLIDMIEEGYLVDVLAYRVKTNVSIYGIRKASGDFMSKKLEAVINVKNRNQLIVNEYIKLSEGKKL